MDVLGLPIPDGYEIPFILTLVIILVKTVLALYLLVKVIKKRKEQNVFALHFIGSVLFFMALAAVARLFYMVFDFFLTRFDETTYVNIPHIWFWKMGSLLSALGITVIVWILDRKILGNKFKGIFAIIMIIGITVQFTYPVSTFADFELISTIGVVASAGALLIPILFIYIAVKTPGLRKISVAIAIGAILYTIGGSLVSATFIELFRSALGFTTDMVYLLSISMKVVGLLAIAYGGVHFKI